jgi:AraC-like DNA-binding protein
MSARALNDGFKELYGQSIHAYLVDRQLDQAHRDLEETDIAMKVLAVQAGYCHVVNFSAAFKRRFGYPPGELRRLTNRKRCR